jgi:hypothetical protein
MPCSLWRVGFIVILTAGSPCFVCAQDKTVGKTDHLKRLLGRWMTVREQKDPAGKLLRTRVELEFASDKLNVFVLNEDGTKRLFDGQLRILGVEQLDKPGLGWFWRINLGGRETETRRVDAYFDFVGENLILVGRIGWRPWEGFHLSGDYKRAEKPK